MPKALDGWKFCTGCKKTKTISEFSHQKDKPDGLTSSCKECRRDRTNKWKSNNKEYTKKYNKEYKTAHRIEILAYHKEYEKNYRAKRKSFRDQVKAKFLEMYGGACSCCGESRNEFLTLEHKQGQVGVKNKQSSVAYRKAIMEYQPNLYDVLCMNCNFSRGKFGYCPHDKERL